MLALRSILVIDALDEPALRAAVQSAADAVAIDLASPAVHADRARARSLAAKHARAIATTGRPVFARVSDARSGELEADLDAVVTNGIAALILAGVETPQDVRDIDVAARKREWRASLEPGRIRLIPEIDSAAGLVALTQIIDAVDRHDAVALSAAGIRRDFVTGERDVAVIEHAMAVTSVAVHAAGLTWMLSEHDGLASRANDFAAAGVTVRAEAAVLGMNALFTLDPAEVEDARAEIAEWERIRRRDGWVGVLHGVTGDRIVERRTIRAARALVARADAIEARERI